MKIVERKSILNGRRSVFSGNPFGGSQRSSSIGLPSPTRVSDLTPSAQKLYYDLNKELNRLRGSNLPESAPESPEDSPLL